MAKRGRKPKAEKARKKVTVKLLEREYAGKATEAYQILDRLIAKHHSQLGSAKIAIAWRFGWKADTDGRLKLGQAKKGSDLDRELHQYDFVILLNHEAWNQGGLSEKQKEAISPFSGRRARRLKMGSGTIRIRKLASSAAPGSPDFTWS